MSWGAILYGARLVLQGLTYGAKLRLRPLAFCRVAPPPRAAQPRPPAALRRDSLGGLCATERLQLAPEQAQLATDAQTHGAPRWLRGSAGLVQ
ncbi:unnamed protein product, partial [Prorocentrum cordatum]